MATSVLDVELARALVLLEGTIADDTDCFTPQVQGAQSANSCNATPSRPWFARTSQAFMGLGKNSPVTTCVRGLLLSQVVPKTINSRHAG
jgi:hypothetical protein